VLEADGAGHWLVDGETAPHLNGCPRRRPGVIRHDQRLPVHRTGLLVGSRAAAPAVYVRALYLAVERLEQTYTRIADETGHQRYDYTAPPSSSPTVWSTTRLVWSSTIPESPSGQADATQMPRTLASSRQELELLDWGHPVDERAHALGDCEDNFDHTLLQRGIFDRTM